MIFLMYTDIFFIRNFSRALYNWMQCKVCMQLDLRTSRPRSYCIVSCSSSTKEKWYLLICTHACLIVIFCLLIVGEVVFSVWLHTFFNFFLLFAFFCYYKYYCFAYLLNNLWFCFFSIFILYDWFLIFLWAYCFYELTFPLSRTSSMCLRVRCFLCCFARTRSDCLRSLLICLTGFWDS